MIVFRLALLLFGLATLAFTNGGGGVFCFSNSSIRAWAARYCSSFTRNWSKTWASCSSSLAICSSAVIFSVYQTRLNLNSILVCRYFRFFLPAFDD
jgi:hypothetical protein